MGAIGTRKQKVSKTFVGGERRFWKSFQKMAVGGHACMQALGQKTKVGV
jgi:hypothetical protein